MIDLEYNSKQKAIKIIKSFLISKDLYSWVHSGYYDFKYTPKQFLRKICLVFELDYKNIESDLKKQEIYYDEIKRVQQNYIFVNTNFKRKNEPIFTLALLESRRRIKLNEKRFVFKTKEESLDIVSLIVQEHFQIHNGNLSIWGKVVNYIYYHNAEKFTFSYNGKIIKNTDVKDSRVILKIKGKITC